MTARAASRCRTGKRRFRDEVGAKLALARILGPRGEARAKAPCRAYACPICHGWHLTSQDRRAA